VREVWRWLFRLPPLLYRVGLAERAGRRFLLLTTRGRRTGRRRTCALNYMEDGATVYIFSGFGMSHWVRNLLADPAVEVQLGSRRIAATASLVRDPATRCRALTLLRERGDAHGPPKPLRPLLALFGIDYDARLGRIDPEGEEIPVIALARRTST
jgi:deazaflavin-dependent oxidoreductase (nitroreductase family)